MFKKLKLNKNKLIGYFYLFLILVMSVCVYMFSLSILIFTGVYSFFMIRMIILIYSKYFGFLDKKAIRRIYIISFIYICIGYYFAYVTYYRQMFYYEGYPFWKLLIYFVPLISKVDVTIFPGILFFISITFVLGIYFNRQFIKYEQVNGLDKRLTLLKLEYGIENIKEKDDRFKKTELIFIIISFITLALGIYNEGRFADTALLKLCQNELSELKTVDKYAYDRVKNTLKGQRMNYQFIPSSFYVRGEDNTVYINAHFDEDEYVVYCVEEEHGPNIELEWGEWISRNGVENLIPLYIKVKGEGYGIVTITNDVDSNYFYIIVDNYNYDN